MNGHRINQHDAPAAPVATALSDEQFATIIGLLRPVHDLAVAQLAMIAQMNAQREAAAPADAPSSIEPTTEPEAQPVAEAPQTDAPDLPFSDS